VTTLANIIRVFQEEGCSLDPSGRQSFAVFEPLTPIVGFDQPFAVFVMGPGCDQAHYHGQTATFYFVRSEPESDNMLHCWDRHGLRTTFYLCLYPEARERWARYRDRTPAVQEIEAAAVAERKASLAEIVANA